MGCYQLLVKSYIKISRKNVRKGEKTYKTPVPVGMTPVPDGMPGAPVPGTPPVGTTVGVGCRVTVEVMTVGTQVAM